MDKQEREKLRQNRVDIVNILEPIDCLDHLQEEGILTDNDCEHIYNTKNRGERCHILLALLSTRGPKAYGAFTSALERSDYTQLETKLKLTTKSRLGETGLKRTDELEQMSNTEGELTQREKDEQQTMVRADMTSEIHHENPFCFMEDSLPSQVLFNNYAAIVQNVNPTDVIDLHYQEELLDDDQCERIRAGVTRRDKCAIFLRELSRHRPEACLPVLQRSLEKKYGFLSSKLKEATSLETKNYTNEDTSPKVKETSQISESTGEISPKQQKKNTSVGQQIGESGMALDTCQKRHKRSCRTYRTTARNPKGHDHCVIQEQNRQKCDENVTDCSLLTSQLHVEICQDPPIFLINPGCLASAELPNRRLIVAFNFLSFLINQGCYDKFETFSTNIRRKYFHDPDMICVIEYLHASRTLHGTNFDKAKRHINSAFQLVSKTSNPKYFTIELFTATTRMYISQKKLQKLQTTLDDAKMIVETDPRGCTGRAGGWLYVNVARSRTSQIALLNFRNPTTMAIYEMLHNEAKESFQKALGNFQQDGGNDGPFGFGYALCRLAILLLRCGDNGHTMNILHPNKEDIVEAGSYLTQVENSDFHISKILNIQFLLAKCDYQFRRKNMIRALEHAEAAYVLANEVSMSEFKEHARNRQIFLKKKSPLILEGVSEKDATSVLFGSSSDESADDGA